MTISTIQRALLLAALTTSLLLSAAAEGRSQTPRGLVTTAVWADPAVATLMLVAELPAPASAKTGAVIVRRPGDPPNNIIMVTRSTSPTDLARAMTALAFSRRQQGDQVEREVRTAITASASRSAPATRDEQRASADLRRVRLAPELTVAKIARGPAIVIRMADSAVTRPATAAPNPARPPQP